MDTTVSQAARIQAVVGQLHGLAFTVRHEMSKDLRLEVKEIADLLDKISKDALD